MKRQILACGAAVLLAFAGSPAQAGYSLVSHDGAVTAGAFTVRAGEDWNRDSRHPVKKGEVWTLDGPSLNELYFVSGLAAGETLFRDLHKKDQPLPKMAANMALTDIPEFYESSVRLALNTSLFEIGSVAPDKIDGHDGVRFTYRYVVQGAPLVRQGVAVATLVKGQLYLISFAAPKTFYFDRDAPRALAIMASAKI